MAREPTRSRPRRCSSSTPTPTSSRPPGRRCAPSARSSRATRRSRRRSPRPVSESGERRVLVRQGHPALDGRRGRLGCSRLTLAGGKPKPQFVAYLASTDDAKAIAAITTKGDDREVAATTRATASSPARTTTSSPPSARAPCCSPPATRAAQASIDAREGDDAALARAPRHFEALEQLPEDNLLVGYADGAKVAQLVGTRPRRPRRGLGGAGRPPGRPGAVAARGDPRDRLLGRRRRRRLPARAASTLLDEAKKLGACRRPRAEAARPRPADALAFAGTPGLGATRREGDRLPRRQPRDRAGHRRHRGDDRPVGSTGNRAAAVRRDRPLRRPVGRARQGRPAAAAEGRRPPAPPSLKKITAAVSKALARGGGA